MTRFSASTEATAVITATRAEVWAVLSDPDAVAELTPFVSRITADGDHWRWQLGGLEVAGMNVSPAFTEAMTYDEPSRIEFRHDPPEGTTERSSVEGWYDLAEADGGTRLSTSLEITLDLPLPKLSGPVVRTTMKQVINQMGDRFSENLLRRLDAQEV
ncbi:SRPBCC family protein [Nocardioides bruguierae]|uniref:SRPBCC family protein n=1 Tax=Nocardioides bruguierae TaxID=2945102 RepID=A0A9X2D8C2_9ACTN|nr:SRPBCC family protein [Nocardioides bruguierae]MCM0621031.1 SRPBCC family protein [Nocardioides bruguierae]